VRNCPGERNRSVGSRREAIMPWRQRIADWIAPAAAKVAGVVEAAADEAKDRAVVVVQTQAPGMSRRLVLFLLTLSLLLLSVGGYAIYWRYLRPVKPPAALVPVQTQGGGNVYQGNQVPAMAKAAKAGKPAPRVTVRPVATIPVDELPPEEQAKAPAIPPAAGPDNVVRKVELADTQIVPSSRGETYTRAYLLPDGTVKIFQDPQREKFWGLPWKGGNWKRIELEGGYGIGGKQIDAQASWWPVRIGNFHVGARAEAWMEPAGGMKGAASIRVRWEPFRDSYR
jgi:hypothetical protein